MARESRNGRVRKAHSVQREPENSVEVRLGGEVPQLLLQASSWWRWVHARHRHSSAGSREAGGRSRGCQPPQVELAPLPSRLLLAIAPDGFLTTRRLGDERSINEDRSMLRR